MTLTSLYKWSVHPVLPKFGYSDGPPILSVSCGGHCGGMVLTTEKPSLPSGTVPVVPCLNQ